MTSPLRVVMPALTYVPGAMGGSETDVRALVAELQARDDIELTVLSSRSGAGGLGAVSEHVVRSVHGGASTRARLANIASSVKADRGARQLMRAADVVHFPFTVPVPLPPRGIPWVQTLLDVQHRDLPQMFSRAERLYRAAAYDAPARRSTRVLTISDFCRDRITTKLGIPLDRIDVAHLGVDRELFTPSSGPREPFVFYPAAAWPHKNHKRLIAAMSIVRERRPDLRLVLTGGRREALGVLPGWVEHRGHVPEGEVRSLLRSAACLAFPSLYEGFGLPPLEAMASGCPVAAADSGSIPEVCGSAAVLYDARDARAIARGIERAIADEEARVAKGMERAKSFSWRRCAEAHVESFSTAVQR